MVQRYREGLAAAGRLAVSSVRRQIEMYHGLGVLAPTTAAVLPLLDELQAPPTGAAAAPGRVIVFTGHRMTEAKLLADEGRYGFRCIGCGEIHHWQKADAWLETKLA